MAIYMKPGFASYNERGVEEIPVATLLEKNGGDLEKLEDNLMKTIISFVPKEPSPFNTYLPTLKELISDSRKAGLFVVHLDHPGLEQPFDYHDPAFNACNEYSHSTLDLILELGISARPFKEHLSLRWAAARGPWPAETEDNMCENRLKPCLRAVYYSIIELIREDLTYYELKGTITPHHAEHILAILTSDLGVLNRAWHGVGAWLS